MTFNSFSYFIFLPLVYLLSLAAGRRCWLVLLGASYGFYAALGAPHLLAVLLAVTVVSYLCGGAISRCRDENGRRRLFWSGTAACLFFLALPKYLLPLGGGALPAPLMVSIGVSYFCFQAISYLADVYLEDLEPEGHFGRHALSLAFFPKLLQGPIERGGDLLPQLALPGRFDYDRLCSGLLLFGWGLFRKVVVADRLGLYADQVYNDVHAYTGLPLLVATYAYALQIWFDFAGYTDMARGSARLFGIELTENFRAPYLATSIAEFWRRWHISFSRWILDYIFKPLQMAWRDQGRGGTAPALAVTFLASGLWHGATWGFIAWGGLHGSYLALSTFYAPYRKRVHRRLGVEKSRLWEIWQVAVTFHLVCFAWIFFRADGIGEAWYVVTHLFRLGPYPGGAELVNRQLLLGRGVFDLFLVAASLFVAWGVSRLREVPLLAMPLWVRWPAFYTLALAILFFGVYRHSSFIYFKF